MLFGESEDLKMKVKELENILPKYNDGSGFDCQIIYNNGEHPLFLCEHDLYKPNEKPEQRDLEVEKILPGLTRSGGNFDDTLAIVVDGREEWEKGRAEREAYFERLRQTHMQYQTRHTRRNTR